MSQSSNSKSRSEFASFTVAESHEWDYSESVGHLLWLLSIRLTHLRRWPNVGWMKTSFSYLTWKAQCKDARLFEGLVCTWQVVPLSTPPGCFSWIVIRIKLVRCEVLPVPLSLFRRVDRVRLCFWFIPSRDILHILLLWYYCVLLLQCNISLPVLMISFALLLSMHSQPLSLLPSGYCYEESSMVLLWLSHVTPLCSCTLSCQCISLSNKLDLFSSDPFSCLVFIYFLQSSNVIYTFAVLFKLSSTRFISSQLLPLSSSLCISPGFHLFLS